ncbi:MAG: HD domain-containing protein [Candidatus Pacebacteria bacterium]|nr:HD domain-containing protein [Candidatus Paceibacterota bacterium]
MSYKIPKEILNVLERLEANGFEAYLVGGCVRDLLLNRKPKDWDATTNAKPEEIQKIFPDSFYENDFGTVGVITGSEDETLKAVEITPYRIEAKYTDKRHPDIVRFGDSLEEDLSRRDFTINAMALLVSQSAYLRSDGASEADDEILEEKFVEIRDPFGGKNDLKAKVIKTVGNPEDRFEDDALRIMRAVRLAAEVGFEIEPETVKTIKEKSHLLKAISMERIRDEFSKLLMSASPKKGIEETQEAGILKFVAPELEEGIGVGQNKEHIFTVWEHNLRALQHAADKNFSLEIRMAALFHDIGKPRTKWGEGIESTFYSHEVVGAKMTVEILSRLRYPKKFIEKVGKLVRWHLFFSDTDIITLSAVRRLARNVGEENVWDLMNVRFCDRIGMGRPKEEPYRLRKYESMVEEALRSPLNVSKLDIKGEDVMKAAAVEPGPKVGFILHALLEEVLDEPERNKKDYLSARSAELAKLPEEEIKALGEEGKARKDEEEQKELSEIRKKYGVR